MNTASTSSSRSSDEGAPSSTKNINSVNNPEDTTNRTTDAQKHSQRSSQAPRSLTAPQKRAIALYIFLRLAVFLLLMVIIQGIAGVLGIGDIFPWAVSALLGFFISIPLSLLTMDGLRRRVSEYIAIANTASREHKRRMQEELEQAL